MCGIIGYNGTKEAIPTIIGGLYRLEYRGYDSAGIATVGSNRLEVHKCAGKVYDLDKSILNSAMNKVGIGHTRWATHGEPSKLNSHPLTDCYRQMAVVHNGVIDNYASLRAELKDNGHILESQTDSEVIVHLLEGYTLPLLDRVVKMVKRLEGTFALAIVDKDEPDKIIAVKKGSPLIIGFKPNEMFISSDIAALSKHTNSIFNMNDNEIAVVTKDSMKLYNFDGDELRYKTIDSSTKDEDFSKGEFEHFMLKEIYEQPEAIERLLDSRPKFNRENYNMRLVGCGSAYYAAQYGTEFFGPYAVAAMGSEFVTCPGLEQDADFLFLSQSGETYDTLEAAKSVNAACHGLINTEGSALSKVVTPIYLKAGPEQSVASTKVFTSMVTALAALSEYVSLDDLMKIPNAIREALKTEEQVKALAGQFIQYKNCFFIGRETGYAIALEAAQKLKEISYIHAEAYPSGELKHGPLALITPQFPTIAIVPNDHNITKNMTAIEEIKTRGGKVIVVTNTNLDFNVDTTIRVPSISNKLDALICLIPLQLFAYHCAAFLNKDIDRPRNISKCVTVP